VWPYWDLQQRSNSRPSAAALLNISAAYARHRRARRRGSGKLPDLMTAGAFEGAGESGG